VAALAILAAVGHVLVLLEAVPAIEKTLIVADRGICNRRQQFDRLRRFDEQEIFFVEPRGDLF